MYFLSPSPSRCAGSFVRSSQRCVGSEAAGMELTEPADYGCWTLLHTDPTEGALQVFLGDENGESEEGGRRGTWITANPLPNAFVVNIGEMVRRRLLASSNCANSFTTPVGGLDELAVQSYSPSRSTPGYQLSGLVRPPLLPRSSLTSHRPGFPSSTSQLSMLSSR